MLIGLFCIFQIRENLQCDAIFLPTFLDEEIVNTTIGLIFVQLLQQCVICFIGLLSVIDLFLLYFRLYMINIWLP